MSDQQVPHPPPPRWAVSARNTGLVAAVFSAVVALLLIFNYQPPSHEEPLTSEALNKKREQLRDRAKDEALIQEIRELDAEIRTQFFATQQSRRQGGLLLLAGAIIAIAALKVAGKLTEVPDDPRERPAPDLRSAAAGGRLGLAIAALALLGGLAGLALVARDAPTFASVPPPSNGDTPGVKPGPPDFPTLAEWKREWPIFRGPMGDGVAQTDTAPREWDGAAGTNILWKTAVPLHADNSPIVWGKRLFVSGATKQNREVYCFDVDSGKLLWQHDVVNPATANAKPPKIMEETGWAPNTMATDGRRVYAMFVNGDLAAFTVDGKKAWVKSLGTPLNSYGHACSLTMWQHLLIVQFDQKNKERSALLAFDGATGKEVWRTPRPVSDSWCTPFVIRSMEPQQIICSGRPWTMAYTTAGKELWRAKLLDADVAPTPVHAKGMVFVTNAYAILAAVRLGGTGDVTKTHVAWEAEDGLPDCVSPLCDGERIYLFDDTALMTAYDIKDGKKLYEHEFDETFNASPVLVGKTLYCLDTKGTMFFIEAGPKFKLTGKATLGEEANASPAILRNRIYLRGKKHLFAIGAKP